MAITNPTIIQTYGFPGFRGLNLKDGPLTVPPQFAKKANFVDFGVLGTIEKAEAPDKLNSSQIASNPAVLAMAQYTQNDGTRYFVAYTSNGKMYKLSIAGAVTDITPSNVTIATGKFGHFFQYNNLLWFSDGVNDPVYVYDTVTSSEWFELGQTAPSAGPSAATGGGGLVEGTNIQYKVQFESVTGARSNASALSGKVSPGGTLQVDLTNVVVNSDAAENTEAGFKRLIFRNVIEDDPNFFYVGSVNDNVTTIFTDNVTNANLGELLVEEREKPASGIWGFTEYHGSVYGFVPGTHDLLYSNPLDAEGWGAFNIEPITPGDGFPITGLGKLQHLVIFKKKGIHNWIGYPGLFRRDGKVTGHGCLAHRSVKTVDLPSGGDVLFFLSQSGPRFYDEQDSFLISREIEPIFTGKDPTYQFNHSKANQASAEYSVDDRRYMLSIPVNGSSENNLLLIYDVYAGSWNVREPLYCGSITLKSNANDQDQVVIGESRSDATYGGWISLLENEDNYYDEDYKGEYQTQWNHFGSPNHTKMLRYIEVDAESSGEYNLMIDIYVDGASIPIITVPMSLSEVGFTWDGSTSLWDTATWAKDDFLTKIESLRKVQGRWISVGFRTDDKGQPWKVLASRIQYQLLPNAGTRR